MHRARFGSLRVVGLTLAVLTAVSGFGLTTIVAGFGQAHASSGVPLTTCSTTNGTKQLNLHTPSISGYTVTINGLVVAAPGSELTGIDWKWGDGTAETGCIYFPESHSYTNGGTYTVTVTTTFSDGSQLQATEPVNVPSNVSSNCSTTNGSPLLDLFTPTTSGLTATINGVVIVPSGLELSSLNWSWGDGSSSPGCSSFPESHTYAKSGTYSVDVTATFSNGSSIDANTTVIVSGSSGGGSGTITQNPPTTGSASVEGSTTFTQQLATSGQDGSVTFTTTDTSNALAVSSSGLVATSGGLPAGTYNVSGTDSDSAGDSGDWTFQLTVTGASNSNVPLAPLAVVIENESSTTGFLLFTNSAIQSILSNTESSIRAAGGEVTAESTPLIGVADDINYSPEQLFLAIGSGNDFTTFQDMAFEPDAREIEGPGVIPYAVPPQAALVIIIPGVQLPATEPFTLTSSGNYGFLSCTNSYSCDNAATTSVSESGCTFGLPQCAISSANFSASTAANFDASTTSQFDASVSGSDIGVAGVVDVTGPALSDWSEAAGAAAGSVSTTSSSSSNGSVTATATGVGAVTTGQYGSTDPQVGLSTCTGLFCTPSYFDVQVSVGNSFSTLDVNECLTQSSAGPPQISWWDPNGGLFGLGAWTTIESAGVDNYAALTNTQGQECVSFTLTPSTDPPIAAFVGSFVQASVATFTSQNQLSAKVGAPFSFGISTSSAQGVDITGMKKSGKLPRGVRFTPSGNGSAIFSGTPSSKSGGVYGVTLIASYGTGRSKVTLSQPFTLIVNSGPTIKAKSQLMVRVGKTFSYTIETKYAYPAPANLTFNSLPNGVVLTDNGNGTANLSGELTSPGSYPVTFEAINNAGAASQTMTIVAKS